MDPIEIQNTLRAAIQLARAGDKAQARTLLLQVVDVDERNESAWLWLSAVIERAEDQIVALENVLTINPNNTPARTRLTQLRAQVAQANTPPAPPKPPPPLPPPVAEPTGIDWDDDPIGCVYCGQPVEAALAQCPHCHQSLLELREVRTNVFHIFIVLLCMFNLQGTVFSGIGPLIAYARAAGVDDRATRLLGEWEATRAILGPYLGFTGAQASLYLSLTAVHFVYLMGAMATVYYNAKWGYRVLLAMALFDAAFIAWAANAYLGSAIIVWSLAIDAALVAMTLTAIFGQLMNRKRLFLEADKDAHADFELFRRGERYAQRNMLALAALHYKRAIIKNGKNKLYYKTLALTQLKLGRTTLAQRTVEQALLRFGTDTELQKLLEQVKS